MNCEYCGIEFEDDQYFYCPYCGSILDHFYEVAVQSTWDGIELAENELRLAPVGTGGFNHNVICTDGLKTYVNCLFNMDDGNLELCHKMNSCEIKNKES